ncbi:serine-type D-Ala-D-Ala carboxypeptidase [Gilliamella sp. Choc4-2]|uniref:serine hydrolase n=1 Tax=unclassified Gilliamella TaxID=2685620 RepID=UPI0004DCBFE6|nr:serine hydrolase [Gilliamella apicola]KFA58506.1 D-alanyl-D-alanine carboxypeptidase [Gilliamella apicola]OCG29370.1 serine-type D-Ala-D-Ala carboxypeptidase [Gilliamella apicola]OCG46299.1 serine-type D-Ala-D-Ala carboxypeptidase [Gilliamella apicola]OCG55681.1 serine-type D-Ala-D-Ala carboxypeptidase [Gilliamella apicola]OCG62188.1 serine-type D-Ala-D-Ala carboxypeptidase [Gilliamella apicola]
MKKKFKLSFALLLLAICSSVSAEVAFPIPEIPKLDAESYILMDAKSGEILAQYNAEQQRDPASLTKMMTSYVVGQALKVGRIKNDDMVIVSKDAWATGNPILKGSSLMFLEVGKKVSVSDLNKGIIVQSGNDACIAMAEHVAGSQGAFVNLMNDYAKKIGLEHSHFETVHGLDAPGQYTTAKDMALLGQALIRDLPSEYAIYKEKEFTYNLSKPQLNRNGLLWDTTLNVDGIKTGHTNAAGYNLVASAVDGNTRLISAVLGGRTFKGREQESKKLLVWGFRFFETANPVKAGNSLITESIWYGEQNKIQLGSLNGSYVTVPKGRSADVQVKYTIDGYIYAPITKGTVVGKMQFLLDDKVINEESLVALQSVEETGFLGGIWDWICLQCHKLLN